MNKQCPYKEEECVEDECMAWRELFAGYDDNNMPTTFMGCRLIEMTR